MSPELPELQEIEVLKEIARRLNKAGIPYMITGSIATNFYAVPRMTRDIDIVIELEKASVDQIVKIFQDDFYVDREMIIDAVLKEGVFNLIHNEWVIKIDFIVRKDSEYRLLEFQRRRQIEIEGVKMWIVSPEDLILSKLYWARESKSEMQLMDVKNILSMIEHIDIRYIELWVRSLDIREVYEKVKQ